MLSAGAVKALRHNFDRDPRQLCRSRAGSGRTSQVSRPRISSTCHGRIFIKLLDEGKIPHHRAALIDE